MNLKGTFKQISIVAIALVISIAVCIIVRGDNPLPLKTTYAFNSPSGVFIGKNDRQYVIDGAKKMLLVIDEKGELKTIIQGGKEKEGFYYASLICDDLNDNVYVADTLYSDMGTILKKERIIKYDNNGRYQDVIYEINYDDPDKAPLQYGNIQSLVEKNGFLIFTEKFENGINVVKLNLVTGKTEKKTYDLGENIFISSADVNINTLLPVFITRKGEVCCVEEDLTIRVLATNDIAGTAWKLVCENGDIYYSDLASQEIKKVTLSGDNNTVLKGESILYTVSAKDGKIYSTDYAGIYISEADKTEYVTSVKTGNTLKIVVIIICLIIVVLSSLYLILNTVYIFKNISKNRSFQKSIIIIMVSLSIAALVVYLTLSTMLQFVNQNVMKELNLFCEIMVENTDVETLSEIEAISDYRGPAYSKIKDQLDEIVDTSYNNGLYYYYVLYRHDEKMIYGVMDYEDTMTAHHPFYNWGDNGYTEVFKENKSIEVSNDVSSYGTWSFVLKPITDQEGNVVAVMELGVNNDEIQKTQTLLIKEIMLTIICSVVVMIIIMLEVVFYLTFRDRKAKAETNNFSSLKIPVRSIIFVTFLADSMQDAFIPILTSKRYLPILNIPKGIGVALPITSQLLMTALFSFLGGGIVTRIGVKKTLIQGFFIQMIGFIVCAYTTSYLGILVGKTILGIGMGLIIVAINTVAAVSEQESAASFGEINAGILAGVTAGVGIGSIILSIGSYATVYSVGAALLFCGLLMAIFGSDYRPSTHKKGKVGVSIIKFVFNREILTFLLMILMPFLIALSYREYFFPLYAQHMGISESNIGYLYLVSGVIVIYMGPILTKILIEKIGAKGTVITSSILMCLASLLFALFSSLTTAIIGIFILSIAISFGYAAQSTYYSSRPIIAAYGEGRAMGVYTLFDNGGQTLGPIIYGSVLTLGYQSGVSIVGIALTVLVLLFVLGNFKRGDK